jgi:subtilisin family serine protease
VRGACGTILCASALLLAAPLAHASSRVLEREALRVTLGSVSAASTGTLRLPLPEPGAEPRTRAARGAAATRGQAAGAASIAAAIAHATGPQHVLVGARTHAGVPPLRATLERLGARVETVDALGVLAATVPSGAALARALTGNPHVAYVEPDRSLGAAADPFDAPDPAHGNLPFTWAYDEVRAGAAIAAAGGGSRRSVAIIDTGADVGHPDLAANVGAAYDTATGGADVTDAVGHGTFVAGLIAAQDGNGIGTKGVAGATTYLPIRASIDGTFKLSDVVRGLQFAVRHGADVVNLSLAGNSLDRTSARALDFAFYANVLPVAASGNLAQDGNPLQYPAAFLGGLRGKRGIGLSVAATKPGGIVAEFSNHNLRVSVAAPGASDDCRKGVFSTIPRQGGTAWDGDPSFCSSTGFTGAGGRWAYAQGTSFAAPIAAGVAAVVWQVEPRLASEQVGDVILRSARQTLPGARWNEFTGTGVVDGEQAVALARRYDVRSPRARASAARVSARRVVVRVRHSRDRTDAGRELAGRVRYALLASRDGGRSFGYVVRPRRTPIRGSVSLSAGRRTVIAASVCDGNGNCGVKRLGRFSR